MIKLLKIILDIIELFKDFKMMCPCPVPLYQAAAAASGVLAYTTSGLRFKTGVFRRMGNVDHITHISALRNNGLMPYHHREKTPIGDGCLSNIKQP